MASAATPVAPGGSERRICEASPAACGGWCCCRSQYCITMAMLAGPQPFLGCATNGTSSQRLRGCSGAAAACGTHTASDAISMAIAARMRATAATPGLTHGHDDENQRGNGDEDDQQIMI